MDISASQIELAYTFILILLTVVFFYLVFTRLLLGKTRRSSRGRSATPIEKSRFRELRDSAKNEIQELEQRLKHLRNIKNETKKRFMKGEISNATFTQLDKENDVAIIGVQARLSTLKQAAK